MKRMLIGDMKELVTSMWLQDDDETTQATTISSRLESKMASMARMSRTTKEFGMVESESDTDEDNGDVKKVKKLPESSV